MRSIRLSVILLGVALVAVMAAVEGCGSNNGSTPSCGNGDSCQQTDPICSRSCGRNQARLCHCGTGPLAGTLVCDDCMDTGTMPGTGGRGPGASGGRSGRGGTGGTMGPGTASGGRMGRSSGGNNGSASGGTPGTGGYTPSDAGTPICPPNAQAGGASCTASATPICQTACENAMFNICTCLSGSFVCPASQIACP
ncbi:MAG: hypothetical protein H7X95_05240 [Deltaproteobacteria bacterium]|nr:hypothetical protein [Deltaproteobacteria bacterium]